MEAISLNHMEQQELIFEKPLDVIKVLLPRMSKHALVVASKTINQEREHRYPHKNKRPKYNNLPRCLQQETLNSFFQKCQYKNIFLRALYYGLRPGEASTARIVPGQNLVAVDNDKVKGLEDVRIDYLPLIPGTEHLFEEQGPSTFLLQREFRRVMKEIGNYTYALSTKGRPLNQFTMHSLRHTAANLFQEHTGNPFKVSCFLRHDIRNAFGSTGVYMHYDLESMRRDLESLWSSFKY